jgi:hypothetical protein
VNQLEELGKSDAPSILRKSLRVKGLSEGFSHISEIVTKCLLGVTVPESPNHRVFLVRQALGTIRRPLAQDRFAELLTLAAQRLGLVAKYYGSTVSDIEAENRTVTLDDARVVAAVDPLRRGEAWLAFGQGTNGQSVLDLDPTRDRRLTDEELDRAERLVAAKDRAAQLVPKRAAGGKKRGRS